MALDNLRNAVAATSDKQFAAASWIVLTSAQITAMKGEHAADTNPKGRLFLRNIVPTSSFFGRPVVSREVGESIADLTGTVIDYRTQGTA